ncbi:hypothetical protein IGI04_019999 [Brassica rapa subsp. trilocularis]|uniref:Uncharacterized protein n=1 Tax=Brassica rapa subsp. trilocularis TaxID=1813537 RepID=A0ABQ7MJW6_BRACM|nr:hypothetical protein IGI04_019999 [Brassica rapa subsp. trilocularis]
MSAPSSDKIRLAFFPSPVTKAPARQTTVALPLKICADDDKEICNCCWQFANMIPSILSAMVPVTVPKKSEKKFNDD